MSLVTLANIKTYMGISGSAEDDLLTIFQDSVEAAILNYVDCSFSSTAVTNEIIDGTRSDIILPRNIPIISIQHIYIGCNPDGAGGSELDTDEFYFDANSITLCFRQTPKRRGVVRVDYTHGYAAVPADVKHAVYEAVKANYQMRKRNAEGVTSRSKNGESESYGASWDTTTGLPSSVIAKLKNYKVWEIPNINTAQRNS